MTVRVLSSLRTSVVSILSTVLVDAEPSCSSVIGSLSLLRTLLICSLSPDTHSCNGSGETSFVVLTEFSPSLSCFSSSTLSSSKVSTVLGVHISFITLYEPSLRYNLCSEQSVNFCTLFCVVVVVIVLDWVPPAPFTYFQASSVFPLTTGVPASTLLYVSTGSN